MFREDSSLEERKLTINGDELTVKILKNGCFCQTRLMHKEDAEMFFEVMKKHKIPCRITNRKMVREIKESDVDGNASEKSECKNMREDDIATVAIGVVGTGISNLLDIIKQKNNK